MTAYCDTSFILEFWQAYVENEDSNFFQLQQANRPKYLDFIKGLLKTENRSERLKPLRRLIDANKIETDFISSVFALTELFEKHAEWNFKSIIADATSIDRTFNKGKKEIADLIGKVYRRGEDEADIVFHSLYPRELDNSLYGIEFKDLVDFNLTIEDFYRKYHILSILQLGTTDIFHLLAAQHLNATHFLTFDSDYVRVKDIVETHMNMTIVFSTEDLNNFTSKLPPTLA